MADAEFVKALGGVASAVGAIALYKYNSAQTLKSRAELIERFEEALQKNRKHAVTELFRMLHGLRLSYQDIVSICSDEESSKIIYALKKTPGMVSYENGKFVYKSVFKRRTFRFISSISMYGVSVLFSLITVLLITTGATSKGTEALAIILVLVPCAAFLGMVVEDIRFDRMVDSIVHREET